MIYDESRLIKMLDALPKELRVAFAALCAERLTPAYAAFARRLGDLDPTMLTSILGRLWRALSGEEMTNEEVQIDLDACMALIHPEDEGTWSSLRAYAEDALAAVAYALSVHQSGESQEAAWAARRVYEALDYFVINGPEIGINKPESGQIVIEHPLIQQELSQQQEDLFNLKILSDSENWRGDIMKLKSTFAVSPYEFLTA